MKLLADECCPAYLVDELRAKGFDVAYIAEEARSTDDPDVLTRGRHEKRIILTEDRDFGELIFANQLPTFGVVLIRIPHTISRQMRLQRVLELLDASANTLQHALTVLTLNSVRTRAMPNPPDDPE